MAVRESHWGISTRLHMIRTLGPYVLRIATNLLFPSARRRHIQNKIEGVISTFKARGAGVLLITHREEITRMADRASQLCGGRIVCSGDPETVAASYRGRACMRCNGEECHDD
jgi:ABC-type multidrug transport system fused ATPase/permease subunit